MKHLLLKLIFAGLLVAVPTGFSIPASSLKPVVKTDPALGPPPTGGGDSWGPILTPDGRYAVFASRANNLAVGSNGIYLPSAPPKVNVFLRDRANATTILVSVNVSGTAGGNGDSFPTGISTNGQFVLFESTASNLVTNDANNASDVFLRDVVNSNTILVSVGTNGQTGSDASQSSTMTPDGRYVAFSSLASNLISGDVNGIADIFVRDMVAGTTSLASPGASNGRSDSPVITPDGHYVAFLSTALGLTGRGNAEGDVYVRDLVNLGTTDASAAARSGSNFTFFFSPAISDNGQYVTFQSGLGSKLGSIYRYNIESTELDVVSSNAVSPFVENMDLRSLDMTPDGRFVTYVGSTNSSVSSTVNLWDAQSNTTTVVSGPQDLATSVCALPTLSSNGQFVVYMASSKGTVQASGVTNGDSYHMYLWNSATASNSLVDAEPNFQSSGDTFMSRPCMTPDGKYIAFDATDSNLGGYPRPAYYNVYLSDQASNQIEVISSRQTNLPSATMRVLSMRPVFSVSSNGQFVAYSAMAGDVSMNSTNEFRTVFVSDLFHGTTTVASVDTNGIAGAIAHSQDPAIGADGRFVAFASGVGNLTSNGVPNGPVNIYVRDLQQGTTVLASPNIPTGGNYSPMIDASGLHVVYFNLTNEIANLFYTDLQSNVTVEVSATANSNVVAAAMTPDGRYVAFAGQPELWDSQTRTIVYKTTANSVSGIAVSPDGNRLAYVANRILYGVDRAGGSNWVIAANAFAPYANLQFSGDSRYLVYVSTAAIVPDDTNSLEDIYRYDFQANTNQLISQSATGGNANGPSDSPTISWDGRFIAYRSYASNLVASVANGFPQIYLYDSQTGATSLASISAFTGGPGNNRSLAPVFSGDSTTLVFQSWASDLLTNDFSGGEGIYALSVAVSPPALIGAIQISPAGAPVISWPANAGANFKLQYKDSLSDPAWLPVPGSTTVVSNVGSITDPSPNSQQRFYRIQSN